MKIVNLFLTYLVRSVGAVMRILYIVMVIPIVLAATLMLILMKTFQSIWENTKKDKINLLDGTPKPLVKRNLTLETCVFWNYYIGEQNNQTVQIANYYNKATQTNYLIRLIKLIQNQVN